MATYNVHGGVDGWGRPFDVTAVCGALDADVLVLQESWAPEEGPALHDLVAGALGYPTVHFLPLALGRITLPPEDPGPRWGAPVHVRSGYGMRLERYRSGLTSTRTTPDPPRGPSGRGAWGVALLARVPVIDLEIVELTELASDPARRGVIVADVAVGPGGDLLRVAGTHLAHITQGSPGHLAVLRRRLTAPSAHGDVPSRTVFTGDMNMWGPPLVALLPGWRRAVRGCTWPSWARRPFAQADHVLVTGAVGAADGEVVHEGRSDHYPVRARLVW